MPTASGYITVNGQNGSEANWSNPTNVSGAPNTNLASATILRLQSTNAFVFTHGLTIPSDATVSAVRVIVRCNGDVATNFSFLRLFLNSKTLMTNQPIAFGVSLSDVTVSDSAFLANATPTNINAGSGAIDFFTAQADVTFDVDSVLLEFDYTTPRNVAPYCNKKFVKSPLIALP